MAVEIIPIVYNAREKKGDFTTMIKDPNYNDSLFIYNDNTEYHHTSRLGAGNALIRSFNQHGQHRDYPRSAGICTGSLLDGGFERLDECTKKVIDRDIGEINDLIKKYRYKRVFYSAKKNSEGLLGTSIFQVDPEVIQYITDKIRNLETVEIGQSS